MEHDADLSEHERRLITLRLRLNKAGMEDMTAISQKITSLEERDELRADHSDIPGIEMLDMEKDKHFAQMLIAIRMRFNQSRDFEGDLDRLTLRVDRMMHGAPEEALEDDIPADTTPASPPGQGAETSPELSTAPATGRMALFSQDAGQVDLFIPALLPPPPGKGCSLQDLTQWLSGAPVGDGGIAIAFDGDAWFAEVTDLEIELSADPDAFLSMRGVKRRLESDAFGDCAAWLTQISKAEAREFSHEDQGAVHVACETVIRQFFPKHPPALGALRAQLVLSPALKSAITFARDLEAAFLEDCDPEEEAMRPPQNPLASAHPDHGFLGAHLLEHAFARHFVASIPMTAALGTCLIEMREAQARRLGGGWECEKLVNNFDELFFEDCRTPLDAFILEDEVALEM